MISPDEDFRGAPLLRKEFRVDAGHGEVIEAMLHATAWGIFVARINGAPVVMPTRSSERLIESLVRRTASGGMAAS